MRDPIVISWDERLRKAFGGERVPTFGKVQPHAEPEVCADRCKGCGE